MATQSLYRRYRPRRFSEVKGQDHVVRALRNAVINQREGQAYLFSGPRGTGKTTSARILAKVLNCERPVDGEPCCECDSCLAVEQGTSYDVHELDAASNNGVAAMRDLIEKASLGTPGRHRVYILDEVHMLSAGAEAALLKTLEEPPPHVVFILATTDPQKVNETIISRTQHLQFHLLPMDVLEEHIRWMAADAEIDLDDDALQRVLRQGGGSARDTVSALELVAASGGELDEPTPLDEFVEAMIDHDPGRALALVAHAVQQGREARLLADDIVRHLRDCFLSLMAPELVQLPAQRQEEVQALAVRLGAAAIVRAMERLGQMLVEMRFAPDPRLLLDVALVQLTHEAMQTDPSVILSRFERLEHAVQAGAVAAPAVEPPPVDPGTGRAKLGGRVRRDESAPRPAAGGGRAEPTPAPAPAPTDEQAGRQRPPDAAAAASAIARWPEVLPKLQGPGPPGALGGEGRRRARRRRGAGRAERDPPARGRGPRARGRGRDRLGRRGARARRAGGRRVGGRPRGAGRRRPPPANRGQRVVPLRTTAPAEVVAPAPPPADEDVDLDELTDVPPESVVTPVERLLQAFPGSQELDERS